MAHHSKQAKETSLLLGGNVQTNKIQVPQEVIDAPSRSSFGHIVIYKSCSVYAGAIRGPKCISSKEAETKAVFCALRKKR